MSVGRGPRFPRTHAHGFVLLEVLVALIVLSLVGLGFLQLFHQAHGLAASSRQWLAAVEYAEDGIELAKIGALDLDDPTAHPIGDGYRRQLTHQPWHDGLEVVTVTVLLPGGGRFEVRRLARIPDRVGLGAALGAEW
jgi:prepilin-type N-terminal cleavage/methylation domain-containing protein